jgi:bifunctional DNase/RNase
MVFTAESNPRRALEYWWKSAGMDALPVPRLGGSSVLVEVRVKELRFMRFSSDNIALLLLQEVEGDRVLPIYIGETEAVAIYFHLRGKVVSRPLTHDLLCSVLRGMGGRLQKVLITKVEEQTYYAELLVQRAEETISLDARPSDSIALALRASANIFANEDLLNAEMTESTEDEVVQELTFGEGFEMVEDRSLPEDLVERLRRLNPEDFGRFQP